MKIVGVTACTAGIAHTYIVAEKIQKAAEAAGHECKIETQGTIGADNVLTEQEIADADVVIIAGCGIHNCGSDAASRTSASSTSPSPRP